jgi:hypothetical protein
MNCRRRKIKAGRSKQNCGPTLNKSKERYKIFIQGRENNNISAEERDLI